MEHLNSIEEKEIRFIDKITKIHIIMFIIYSVVLIVYLSIYMFMLSGEMAMCENNPSRFCPVIHDSTGIVNKPNPNSAVQNNRT